MSTRRALVFSFLDRYSSLTLSILSSMVIARLLTPAEIGVFSVTMVMIMFISALRDLGAGQYLVQVQELTPARVRATWTVLLGTGCFMALIVLAGAWPASRFYHEPRMFEIMLVIAANFAINPFGSMTYAWLMRQMKFDSLAIMRAGSSLAGSVTSVYLAWRGHGPISLAFGSLAATLTNGLISLRYRPGHFAWWPGLKGVREVVGFGSKISAGSLIFNIANGAPELLLGKLQGLAAAGFYSRSNGLALMFQRLLLDATQSVAMPLFATAQRKEGSLNEPFLRSISYVTALGWSFFIGLALLAHPLTRLLYGDQWGASIPVTRLLALGMVINLPCAMCPQALMASGRPGQMLRGIIAVVSVQVLSVAIGATQGLEGAAIGFVLAQLAIVSIWLLISHRHLGFDWAALRHVLRQSATLAGAASLAPLAVVLLLGQAPPERVLPLVLSLIGGLTLFVLSARWLRHPIHEELVRAANHFAPSLWARAKPPGRPECK